MIQILWVYSEIPAILSDVLQSFVSTQGLTHIECVFAGLATRGIITVVVHHASEDAVPSTKIGVSERSETERIVPFSSLPYAFVQSDSRLISFSDE